MTAAWNDVPTSPVYTPRSRRRLLPSMAVAIDNGVSLSLDVRFVLVGIAVVLASEVAAARALLVSSRVVCPRVGTWAGAVAIVALAGYVGLWVVMMIRTMIKTRRFLSGMDERLDRLDLHL